MKTQKYISTKNNLAVFFTAGHPTLNSTESILLELNNSSVDIIEIGIPFSDPMADGEIIQTSSNIALKNGMTITLLFEQLGRVKNKIQKPIFIMTYFNPVFVFGIDRFLALCKENNVTGLIIPDLPPEEFKLNYANLFYKNEICFVPLISPQSSDERIKQLSEIASGFIYVISNNSITGNKSSQKIELENYLKRVKKITPSIPLLIGFGIRTPEDFAHCCSIAEGGIVGSAFISELNNSMDINKNIKSFVNKIKSSQHDYSNQ